MVTISACIEWLFADDDRPFVDRVHAAADAGFDAVEFWLWDNKDLPALRQAADRRGITITGFVTQPFVDLVNADSHSAYLDGLRTSSEAAASVGVTTLITQCGVRDESLPEQQQFQNLVDGLRRAADVVEPMGITLLAEPLNIFDHPDQYLRHSHRGRDVIASVDHPNVKMLYDRYHSFRMDEVIAEGVSGFFDHIREIHIAGPTRNDPTADDAIDWSSELSFWAASGYNGVIGLEYQPRGRTEDGLGYIVESIRHAFA
jgi:hydroxypyruvate isomerase